MKVYLLTVFLVSSLINLVLTLDDETAWREFKTQFNKSYESEAEESSRMGVFLDNLRYVESHNTKSRDKSLSFTQGINHLSDLTTEEINQSRCGFRLEEGELESRPTDGLIAALLLAFNATEVNTENITSVMNENPGDKAWYDRFIIPSKLDYRALGRVSKVKDQGSCGSCWAFATTGALESALARENKDTLLSEQNLVDCSRRYGNYGCNGGLMDAALRYVRDHGIMSSADYPYTGKDGSCRFSGSKSVTSVRGSLILPRGNEALLRIALALTGPIPVAIDASVRSFHSYTSGVYNDPVCRSSNRALNHAVLLVGYGTDSVHGDYWLVKNSWGDKWGDKGFIKMARNRGNLCGIASYAVLPLI